jgi:hypothetical protein
MSSRQALIIQLELIASVLLNSIKELREQE